jgi:hypothetical protein
MSSNQHQIEMYFQSKGTQSFPQKITTKLHSVESELNTHEGSQQGRVPSSRDQQEVFRGLAT